MPDAWPKGLPRRHIHLLIALEDHSSLTRRDYETLTGVSHTTAQADLAELLAAGLIVRLGKARSSRYALPAHGYLAALAREWN